MKKLILIFSMILLSSCASIISGTSTMVNISPSETIDGNLVTVEVVSKSGIQKVQTPATILVKKSQQPLSITVKDKCFRETTYAKPSTLNLWFLGNFITGGFLGTTTDAVTGALWTYDDVVIVPVVPNATCK